MTIDRINALLTAVGLPGMVTSFRDKLHEVLDVIDAALGVDTEWLSSLECQCLWHIGKTCHNRRQVGARLALLEARLERCKCSTCNSDVRLALLA